MCRTQAAEAGKPRLRLEEHREEMEAWQKEREA